MDEHVKARLTQVLDAEGLDALVATTPENLQYVTGFRSVAHALFRGLELYGVFTRKGVGLVIPFIDSTGVSADGIQVDRMACYGNFFFNYADDPGPIGARVREITAPIYARVIDGFSVEQFEALTRGLNALYDNLADLVPPRRRGRDGDS